MLLPALLPTQFIKKILGKVGLIYIINYYYLKGTCKEEGLLLIHKKKQTKLETLVTCHIELSTSHNLQKRRLWQKCTFSTWYDPSTFISRKLTPFWSTLSTSVKKRFLKRKVCLLPPQMLAPLRFYELEHDAIRVPNWFSYNLPIYQETLTNKCFSSQQKKKLFGMRLV